MFSFTHNAESVTDLFGDLPANAGTTLNPLILELGKLNGLSKVESQQVVELFFDAMGGYLGQERQNPAQRPMHFQGQRVPELHGQKPRNRRAGGR